MRALNSAANSKKMKHDEKPTAHFGRRFISFVLCLCMIVPMMQSLGGGLSLNALSGVGKSSDGATQGVIRQADPSTMDKYTDILDFTVNTRHAGQLWMDKTVFAYGDTSYIADGRWNGSELTLIPGLDGVANSQTLTLNDDFMHVYSVLGSSQKITGVPPVRTVIVFDNSGSMYGSYNGSIDASKGETLWDKQRISMTIEAIDRAIDALMSKSVYNEVAVVLFGDGENNYTANDATTMLYHGHNTAVTILPMKHYEPYADVKADYEANESSTKFTPYLTGGWYDGSNKADGDNQRHTGSAANGTGKYDSGWVFVNNEICKLNIKNSSGSDEWKTTGWNNCGDKKYTAFSNGTTNIQAGMYQGMQELLNADKTVKVGIQTYECVPSLVLLTDGAVTDAVTNWMTPDLSEAIGFVNDFSYKGVSFVEHNDPRGTGGDRTNTAWDQFVSVLNEPGRTTMAEEVQRAKDGKIIYQLVASADAKDGKLSYESYTYDKHDQSIGGTHAIGDSLAAMQNLAGQYGDDEAYMIFTYLLTAAYYKQAVKNAYNVKDDWSVYTITVDMNDPSADEFSAGFESNDITKACITSNPAMMDPGSYFNEEWLKNAGYLDGEGNTYYDEYTVGSETVRGIQKAITAWKAWNSGNATDLKTFRSIKSGWDFSTNGVKDLIKDTRKAHNSFFRVYREQQIGVDFQIPTLADAKKQAQSETVPFELEEMDYDYVDTPYYAYTANGSAEDLTNVFVEIVNNIMKPLFQPVGGGNDLGVKDSVTYMDPIGKYMDVKNVQSLILFGEMYGLIPSGVYDYEFNDGWLQEHGKEHGVDPMEEAWYKGDDPKTALKAEAEKLSDGNSVPKGQGFKTAAEAWAAGWVYRLSYATAQMYAPNLQQTSSPTLLTPKQKHTVYTFFRIDASLEDRRALHMNPAYGTDADITEEAKNADKEAEKKGDYSGSAHLGFDGVYNLADLRVWVEVTNDYNDSDVEGEGIESDANFDEALWVNVPVNMLPLCTVDINLGKAVEGESWSYTTNLDESDKGHMASFPLRVFYTVGMSDSLMTPDNYINITSSISPEYIQENKASTDSAARSRGVDRNSLEFFSNWYNPLNRYTAYDTTNSTSTTYGDPVVTFSPSTDNRYYIFEKALPLYSIAYVWIPTEKLTDEADKTLAASLSHGGLWKRVVIEQIKNDAENPQDTTDVRTFEPGSFGGTLLAQDLVPDEGFASGSNADRQNGIWHALNARGIESANDGEIVLLEDHLLEDVTYTEEMENSGKDDPFSSNDYFFLPIEFYDLSTTTKTAAMEKYVVARKGSEFGSAYAASGISNGDMLCWHDVSGRHTETYTYLSRTTTGDDSRGKNYIGLSPADMETLEDPDNEGRYLPLTKEKFPELWAKHEKVMSEGEWVVSARKGGLRVGNMAQDMVAKDINDGKNEWTNYETEYLKQRFPDRFVDGEKDRENWLWGFNAGNVTRTANNYYLPTISTNSDAENEDIIVNTYLGNNGRLVVSDTTLLMAKTVMPGIDGVPTDDDREFKFQVFIDGPRGERDAIVIRWNEATQTWQRQYHYVDLELDGKLFLQTSDGNKALVDSKGCRLLAVTTAAEDMGSEGIAVIAANAVESDTVSYVYAEDCKLPDGITHSQGDSYDAAGDGGPYYVYVGKNEIYQNELDAPAAGFRVFHNQNVDKNISVSTDEVTVRYYQADGTIVTPSTTDYYSGMRKFFLNNVWLVSLETYNNNWVERIGEDGAVVPGTGFNPSEEESSKISERSELYDSTISQFEVLTFDPLSVAGSEVLISSPYRSISTFWTKKVYFGYKAPANGETFDFNTSPQLSGSDIVDTFDPSVDRSSFVRGDGMAYDADYYARHTAEVTLKNGYGLLFSGIPSNSNYRITEVLSEGDVSDGYTLDKVEHTQNYASMNTYKPGTNKFTELGQGFEVTNPDGEGFYNSNAMLWESYATFRGDSDNADLSERGNHHEPNNAGGVERIAPNPKCQSGEVDSKMDDGSIRHYFVKDGQLVDRHYDGEASVLAANRYIVGSTARFGGDDGEKSIYSVFGNTGVFEESGHFYNVWNPDALEVSKTLEDDINKKPLTDNDLAREFDYTVEITLPEWIEELIADETPDFLQNLPYWKGKTADVNKDTASGGAPRPTDKDAIGKLTTTLPVTKTTSAEGEEVKTVYKVNFKLTTGESIVFYDLPAGTKYVVTETEDEYYPFKSAEVKPVQAGNSVDAANHAVSGTVTLSDAEAAEHVVNQAAYTNHKPQQGVLTIEKEVLLNDDHLTGDREFEFEVEFTASEGKALDKTCLSLTKYTKAASGSSVGTTVKDVEWNETLTDGKVTGLKVEFKLRHGEKLVIEGIPMDTKFTVTEHEAEGFKLQHVADGNDPDNTEKFYTIVRPANSVDGVVEYARTEVSMLFVNGRVYDMPMTGGVGAGTYIWYGALCLFVSSVCLALCIISKRRGTNAR